MGKIVLNLAASLDGFIASEDGGVDWLNDFMQPGQDYGMKDFYARCSTAVMGAKTYEQTISFNYWFGTMRGLVFSNRELPEAPGKTIEFVRGDPSPALLALKADPKDSWLVGGATLIAQVINTNLLDELILTVVPRLLGKGLSICPDLHALKKLTLIGHRAFDDGVMQLQYRF